MTMLWLYVTYRSVESNGTDDGYYPGLVNISGTYCFMNSTLQVGVQYDMDIAFSS